MVLSPGKVFRSAARGWYGPFARPGRIVKVTVRDQDFQLVRVLDSHLELVAFRALWAGVVEVDRGSYTWQHGHPYYRLALQSIGLGGRTGTASWFYFPGGYLKLLAVVRAIWVGPLYQTPTPDAFEALLRAPVASLRRRQLRHCERITRSSRRRARLRARRFSTLDYQPSVSLFFGCSRIDASHGGRGHSLNH